MLTEQVELDTPRRRHGLWPWMLLAAGVGVLILFWRFRPPEPSRAALSHPGVGKELTKVELQQLTGGDRPIGTGDIRGKVTLVNFWGTWCPPCRVEFPHLVELAQHFREREDFLFLSVSCSGGEGDEADIAESTAQFLAQQRADFPAYRDAFQATRIRLSQDAGLTQFAYPTTIILDQDGKILGVWLGYASGDEMVMRETVETALRKAAQSSR
jgi:cytochrome c biogenesis protein CcmG/thiol:disulfide interchange protein DsbE